MPNCEGKSIIHTRSVKHNTISLLDQTYPRTRNNVTDFEHCMPKRLYHIPSERFQISAKKGIAKTSEIELNLFRLGKVNAYFFNFSRKPRPRSVASNMDFHFGVVHLSSDFSPNHICNIFQNESIR